MGDTLHELTVVDIVGVVLVVVIVFVRITVDDADGVDDVVDVVVIDDDDVVVGVPVDFETCVEVEVLFTVTVVGDTDPAVVISPVLVPVVVDKLLLCVVVGCEVITVGSLVLVIVDPVVVEDCFGA